MAGSVEGGRGRQSGALRARGGRPREDSSRIPPPSGNVTGTGPGAGPCHVVGVAGFELPQGVFCGAGGWCPVMHRCRSEGCGVRAESGDSTRSQSFRDHFCDHSGHRRGGRTAWASADESANGEPVLVSSAASCASPWVASCARPRRTARSMFVSFWRWPDHAIATNCPRWLHGAGHGLQCGRWGPVRRQVAPRPVPSATRSPSFFSVSSARRIVWSLTPGSARRTSEMRKMVAASLST